MASDKSVGLQRSAANELLEKVALVIKVTDATNVTDATTPLANIKIVLSICAHLIGGYRKIDTHT